MQGAQLSLLVSVTRVRKQARKPSTSTNESEAVERNHHNRQPGGISKGRCVERGASSVPPLSVAQVYRIGPERDSQAG